MSKLLDSFKLQKVVNGTLNVITKFETKPKTIKQLRFFSFSWQQIRCFAFSFFFGRFIAQMFTE